ncbi:uncharacterized protein LOC133815221 [Humulus lupulus]|uniref:uncharacterized protein LOC133815221 n=1 Tax=Humulus lupulus TaxID=3486 RepID=UPI002B40D520|nr:uncharacterized protein LOC133815221 [Humulus lupulus]
MCGGPHPYEQCPIAASCSADVNNTPLEQAHAIDNFPRPSNNPYSMSYTLAWRNHPNMSWKNNQGAQPPYPLNQPQYPPHQPTYGLNPQPYYDPRQAVPQHPPLHPQVNPLEAQSDTLNQFMTEIRSSIRSLETQIGQLANLMSNRAQGNLPSSTEVNPKEQCQEFTLRSGTKYDMPTIQEEVEKTQDQKVASPEQENVTEDLQKKGKDKPITVEHTPKIPYPQRFRKVNLKKKFSKFLKVFKKLHINILFVEALEQIPSYEKFMKDILSKKRRMEDYELVALTEECSAILQRKLPQKLGLGEARPTTVTLQLEDKSVKHPRGIIEDVLVKVEKFIFPADFIVLDMKEDEDVPIILGRPFLATGKTLIDVQKGESELRVHGEKVAFNVFKDFTYSKVI